MAHNLTQLLADEAATLQFGAQFAQKLQAGLTIYLHGDLGAGKTTFTRGVLQGLGHRGKVKSPTYNLLEPYVLAKFNLYHYDLYRFSDEEEWNNAGFREYFNADSICMIEWPEKAQSVLPAADLDITLSHLAQGRLLKIVANSVAAQQIFLEKT
jgi:tRNA threonylcarbamoyladenosine biosynthesis protein TsaE